MSVIPCRKDTALRQQIEAYPEQTNAVEFSVAHRGPEMVRTTRIHRHGEVQRESGATPIRRS